MIISVIGSSKPLYDEHVELAENVGKELAKRGVMVVCGGLNGIMEAVCRGAKSEGGTTIGILPGRDTKDANSYVDIPIVTTMGFSRNVIVVNTGEAVIAAATIFGYVYVSEDGGDNWTKLKKEFGEVRALAITPN